MTDADQNQKIHQRFMCGIKRKDVISEKIIEVAILNGIYAIQYNTFLSFLID